MTADISDYLGRVTSRHSTKPKFMATVAFTVQPFVDAINLLEALPSYFDIDQAIGVQLDKVGERVGRTRYVPVPLEDIWFTFGDPLRGWGKGIWKGQDHPGVTYTRIEDETYRRLLKSKALANEWDGTVPGAKPALDAYFNDPDTRAFLEDRGWAVTGGAVVQTTMLIGVSGKIPSIVDLAILSQNLIPLKPATVKTYYAVTSVDRTPVFGFGVDNDYIGGWGHGSWAVTPEYLLHAGATQ